jgi:hypothetical protein
MRATGGEIMKDYNDKHRVTLTVGEWLTIRLALGDAMKFNRERACPYTEAEQRRVLARVRELTDQVIDEADTICQRDLKAMEAVK